MNTRLTTSHNKRPPITDAVPARYLWRAPANILVAGLRHAGEEQPVHGEVRRQVAEGLERVHELVESRTRNAPRRLEIFTLDQEFIGLFDIGPADLADLHQDLHRLVA